VLTAAGRAADAHAVLSQTPKAVLLGKSIRCLLRQHAIAVNKNDPRLKRSAVLKSRLRGRIKWLHKRDMLERYEASANCYSIT
jgi:hypothetical protein